MENSSRNKKQFHQKSLNDSAELTCSEAAQCFLKTFIFEGTSQCKNHTVSMTAWPVRCVP